tara:strand:+ start:1267 stop:1767 length:501 start_codon:yes stop_codon:yes gene_type:complete
MEQFLRTYFTNLNPNATEEEILAFLQSQGFGSTTTAEGITAITPMPIQTGGDGDGGITKIDLPVGAKPPGPIVRTLATIFAPPVGIAMNLQALADRGKLTSGLNRILGSRSSANVELGLEPQMSDIFTAQSLSDSFAGEEGPGAVTGSTGTMSASDFSDDTPGTPF